jgi:hypothetical protein
MFLVNSKRSTGNPCPVERINSSGRYICELSRVRVGNVAIVCIGMPVGVIV